MAEEGLRRVGRVLCIAKRDKIEKHGRVAVFYYSGSPEGLHFTGKEELMAVLVDEQWFLAETIPGEEQRFVLLIPEGEGEHAIEMLQAAGAVKVISGHDHL